MPRSARRSWPTSWPERCSAAPDRGATGLGGLGSGYPAAVVPGDDQRWIVVDGRRWRATDPGIPEQFRVELVGELMSARRSVAAAGKAGDEVAVASARTRVSDAKVALGERGQPWWEVPTELGRHDRISATIRALARHRGPERTICPSDVARAIGGTSWRSLMPLVRTVAGELGTTGEVQILQKSEVVDPTASWKGPIRIRIA
jgi:hypothetical protein